MTLGHPLVDFVGHKRAESLPNYYVICSLELVLYLCGNKGKCMRGSHGIRTSSLVSHLF